MIKDDNIYRLYHRGQISRTVQPSMDKSPYFDRGDGDPSETTRYLDSSDGMRCHKLELQLFEVNRKAVNNVVLTNMPSSCHNFSLRWPQLVVDRIVTSQMSEFMNNSG